MYTKGRRNSLLACAVMHSLHSRANLPDNEVSCKKRRLPAPVTTPKKINPVGTKYRLISRLPRSRDGGIQALLNSRERLRSRTATIRRQAIRQNARKPVTTLRNPVALTRTLKFGTGASPRTTIRPNFIPPIAALIPPNTHGLPKNPDRGTARGAPGFLRISRSRCDQRGMLPVYIHRT